MGTEEKIRKASEEEEEVEEGVPERVTEETTSADICEVDQSGRHAERTVLARRYIQSHSHS